MANVAPRRLNGSLLANREVAIVKDNKGRQEKTKKDKGKGKERVNEDKRPNGCFREKERRGEAKKYKR